MKYRKLRIAWSVLCVLSMVQVSQAQDEACTFRVRQISQVLDDRPSMKGIVDTDDAVYKWVVKQFDSGFYGDRIYWDRHEPYGGRPAENEPPYQRSLAVVRVTNSDEISGHDKWLMLVFELHNIKNAKLFDSLDASVMRGKLSRADYADKCLSLEFTAMLQTQMFFQHNPLDGAIEELDPYYVGYLEVSRDFEAYKDWLVSGGTYDLRDGYGDRFDELSRYAAGRVARQLEKQND